MELDRQAFNIDFNLSNDERSFLEPSESSNCSISTGAKSPNHSPATDQYPECRLPGSNGTPTPDDELRAHRAAEAWQGVCRSACWSWASPWPISDTSAKFSISHRGLAYADLLARLAL
jgi:hypothetical protein